MTYVPSDAVLDRLKAVKRTGSGTWMARCPAHEDKRPSLSIREGDDGRVLLYDFAGCSVEAIVSALGLDLADLFPPNLGGDKSWKLRSIDGGTENERWVRDNYDHRHWQRRPAPRIPAADVLRVLDIEALEVCSMARKLADCGLLTDQEAASMHLAHDRIAAVAAAWRFQP